jgi:hypothetical protein
MATSNSSPRGFLGMFKKKQQDSYFITSDATLNTDQDAAGTFGANRVGPAPTASSPLARLGTSFSVSRGPLERKLIVIGNAGAGKTSLLSMYLSGEFDPDYTPTIFETTTTEFEFDGWPMKLSLWDTAGWF